MLEIRYNKATKEMTGWWGSRFGNHEIKLRNRPGEAIATLDIGVPSNVMAAYLYDEANKQLVVNQSYIPSPEPINFEVEIDSLKSRIDKLEKSK